MRAPRAARRGGACRALRHRCLCTVFCLRPPARLRPARAPRRARTRPPHSLHVKRAPASAGAAFSLSQPLQPHAPLLPPHEPLAARRRLCAAPRRSAPAALAGGGGRRSSCRRHAGPPPCWRPARVRARAGASSIIRAHTFYWPARRATAPRREAALQKPPAGDASLASLVRKTMPLYTCRSDVRASSQTIYLLCGRRVPLRAQPGLGGGHRAAG